MLHSVSVAQTFFQWLCLRSLRIEGLVVEQKSNEKSAGGDEMILVEALKESVESDGLSGV